MKKFLRFMMVIIGIIALGIIILGIVEPKDITITRNTFIKAPKEAVFNEMVMFRNWVHWSPWQAMDPNMQMTYTGNDGTPGSSYHWVGNKNVGEGDMRDSIVTGTRVDIAMNMIKPIKSASSVFLSADDAGDGQTRATWSMSMHYPFPLNSMLAFMNMDKLLGGDFERGLANMKKYVEAGAATSGVQIQETQYAGHTFYGIRKTLGWSELSAFFADSYGKLGKSVGALANGSPVGIYYTWDTKNQRTDMAAALPVSDTSKPVNGAVCIYIPQSKALLAVHKGGYGSEMPAHDALKKYITDKKMRQKLVVEEYLVGPGSEKDSTKWVTNIYYLVN